MIKFAAFVTYLIHAVPLIFSTMTPQKFIYRGNTPSGLLLLGIQTVVGVWKTYRRRSPLRWQVCFEIFSASCCRILDIFNERFKRS